METPGRFVVSIEAIENAQGKTEVDRAVADSLIEARLAYHQAVTDAQKAHMDAATAVQVARHAAYDRLGLEPAEYDPRLIHRTQ
jgi:hypothetical protein